MQRCWSGLLLICLAAGAIAQEPNLANLKRDLDNICAGFNGRIGYSLILLKDGRRIDLRGDEKFPTASTIKTAIALEALRQVDAGKLKMTDKLAVPPTTNRRSWESSMWSYYLKDGTVLDLDGWVNLMIVVSDNLATRVVREWVGYPNINATMHSLGLPNTMNLASFPSGDERARRLNGQFGMGVTTPNEMARLLRLVYERKAASPEACEKLIRMMSHQYWDDWIGGSAPLDVKVASKSGAISRSRSDTAIVFSTTQPYVLTIYTDSQKDRSWESNNEGHRAITRIAERVWNALHPRRPYRSSDRYRQKFLPTGSGVEDG